MLKSIKMYKKEVSIMHNTLRKIRIDNELTQKEMAKLLGVSRSCVANWETGLREADISIIKKYNQLFGYKQDISNTFLKMKSEKLYSLDMTMLNDEGISELLKHYNRITNTPKYLKKS